MTRSVRLVGSAALACAMAVCGSGCSKKDEPKADLLPAASSLAPSTAAPSVKSVKFSVDAKGKTSIDMPAPKERIKAETDAAGGTLDVDMTNLANTRGDVKIDIVNLSTHTFGNSDDADQTKHARTWLEVSDTVTAEVKEQNRWVVYAIRSIAETSATEVAKVTPTKEGGDDVRTVTTTGRSPRSAPSSRARRSAPRR